jgi:hypothetical protein
MITSLRYGGAPEGKDRGEPLNAPLKFDEDVVYMRIFYVTGRSRNRSVV